MANLTGSCHCGRARFEVTAPIRGFMHCHCTTCRKMHGTVYGSSALVDASGFRLVAGREGLSVYESSPGKRRFFCSTCGAQIYAQYDRDPGTVVLRMGLLDGDPGVRAQAHIWVADKPPWYEIDDDLPRFDTAPDARG